jgi:histidinol-phosphate aminotransferase
MSRMPRSPTLPLVAPHIESVQAYVPGKSAQAIEREYGVASAVKLASNENPLGASPNAVAAILACAGGTHRYADDRGEELRARIAGHHSVAASEVILGHGSNELIDLAVRTFATPQAHAVIGAPSFACYAISLRAANVPFTQVPLRDALYWDLDALLAATRPDTKLVFVDNPNNPTSTHVAASELRAFLRALPEQVVAVIDEAYFDFVTSADYASALAMRELRERLIVLRTFSKAHALASLRVGYGVAPAQLVGYLDRVRIPFNVNAVAQAAALASLDDLQHVARCVSHNTAERARVSDALQTLGLFVAPSQTNFVCVEVNKPALRVYESLLREGVAVRPFGPPLDRHLRVSIGLRAENDRFLDALPRVLAAC